MLKGFYCNDFSPIILDGIFAIKYHSQYPELEIDEDCRYVRFRFLQSGLIFESEIFFDSDESDKNPFFEFGLTKYDLSEYFRQIGQ